MTRSIRAFFLLIPGILLLLAIWAVLIEPRLIDERTYEVAVPNLPGEWEGRTIAFMTDMQVGIFLDNEWTVERIIQKIIKNRPAAVLIGGDFIYHPFKTEEDAGKEDSEKYRADHRREALETIKKAVALFQPLGRSGIPVYTVLGNHDYAMETQGALKIEWVADELENQLREINIPVLQNQSVALSSSGNTDGTEPLFIVGIGAYYPDEGNVEKALAGIPEDAPRIVLVHNPELFPKIPAGQAPLALAGHTHGGQIRIPSLKSWSWLSLVREGEIHSDGWIQNFGRPGNNLYVNRGIGMSKFPIRLNCPPELTWFMLQRHDPVE